MRECAQGPRDPRRDAYDATNTVMAGRAGTVHRTTSAFSAPEGAGSSDGLHVLVRRDGRGGCGIRPAGESPRPACRVACPAASTWWRLVPHPHPLSRRGSREVSPNPAGRIRRRARRCALPGGRWGRALRLPADAGRLMARRRRQWPSRGQGLPEGGSVRHAAFMRAGRRGATPAIRAGAARAGACPGHVRRARRSGPAQSTASRHR